MTKCNFGHLYYAGRCEVCHKKQPRYCRACGGRLKEDRSKVGRPSNYCPPSKPCRRKGSTIIQRRFKKRLKAQELQLTQPNTTV